VAELPFNIDLIRVLAEHRNGFLTQVSLFFTNLGEIEGYVFLISLLYVTYDKKLAIRLAVLTLLAMSLNHILKTLIMNPRPFISQGDFMDRWAVSAAKARELATEYSTPSGHAMAGATFYSYLYANVKSRTARIGFVMLILLTGLSRPYLGVHYLEDVLIGWVVGLAIALFAIRYADRISTLWGRFSYGKQVAIVTSSGLILWLATRELSAWTAAGQPYTFLSYMGLLTGIVVAQPLETREPTDPSPIQRLAWDTLRPDCSLSRPIAWSSLENEPCRGRLRGRVRC
jgi:membrane-associated phospholipid phosphatase